MFETPSQTVKDRRKITQTQQEAERVIKEATKEKEKEKEGNKEAQTKI